MVNKQVMTDEEWVKYYQDNPDMLLGFIKTANEVVQEQGSKLDKLITFIRGEIPYLEIYDIVTENEVAK